MVRSSWKHEINIASGCKSPLTTGVDSFRLFSRHNGKEYCLDVYSDRIISVYGKIDDNGNVNDYLPVIKKIENEDGTFTEKTIFKIYYKKTSDKNMVEISFDVKRHNRSEFINSVKQQLLYIKEDIKFNVINEYGSRESKEVKSKIIYEDDNIIISDDNYYTKPHFVINNVVYGIVDFKELELPERNVNVGIKVSMQDVDVTPNRESIRYNSKTKDTVINKFKIIEELIADKLSSQLKSDDFFEWQNSVYSICSNNNNNSSDVVVNRLGKLIDRSLLNFSFNKIPGSISNSNFYGNFIKVVKINQNYSSKLKKYTYSISDVDYIKTVDLNKIVYFDDNLSSSVKKYFYSNNFTALTANKDDNNKHFFEILENDELSLEDKIKECTALLGDDKSLFDKANTKLKELKRSIRIYHYIMQSKYLKTLDDFDIKGGDDDDDDNDDATVSVKKQPKVKQKADRSKINLTFLGNSKDVKLEKQYINKNKFYYFLTGDIKPSVAIGLLSTFGKANLMTIDNIDITTDVVNKISCHTINGKPIVGLANGNERYVEKHWEKFDFEILKVIDIDDDSCEIKVRDELVNYFNEKYSRLNIDFNGYHSYQINNLSNTLEQFNIPKTILVAQCDYEGHNNGVKVKTGGVLSHSDVYALSSDSVNGNDKIIIDNIISGKLNGKKIIKHNLKYIYPISIENFEKIKLLLKSDFSELQELPEDLVNKYTKEFNEFVTKIYNNITNLKES